MSSSILNISGLQKSYDLEGQTNVIIPNLNLEISKGSFTVIMGSSGTGKSTLLHLIAGIDREFKGNIKINGQNIHHFSEKTAAIFRRNHIGLVFQDALLIPNLTILENVIIGGFQKKGEKADLKQKAIVLLEQSGLGRYLNRLPHQISGGEQQRCAVVRALLNNPTLLLADEPTGNLNSATSKNILDLFLKINEQGQTILMVTHDIRSAALGDRILYFNDGYIIDELNFKNQELSREGKELMLNKWLVEKEW